MMNPADISKNGLARVKKSTGGVDGIVGPDGKLIKRLSIEATNSVLLVCDSMGERSFAQASSATGSTAVDNGDGTATLTFSNSPYVQSIQTYVGDTVRVNNATPPKMNQLAATVTAVDTVAKTVTYTTTGPYSTMIGGNPPYLVLERSLTPLAFFPYLNQLTGGELTVTSNCSQGGAALAEVGQILDAVGQPARFGIFMCGRNDIFARNFTYAQTIAAAKTLLDKFVRKCDVAVVITTPPQDRNIDASGAGLPNYTGGQQIKNSSWLLWKMQAQVQYETWLKQYARSLGCIVVDAGLATSAGVTFRDPASVDANPALNGTPTWTPDGTHQAGISAFALGKAVYNAIKPYVVPTLPWPHGAASVPANDQSIITDNPMIGVGTPGGQAGVAVPGTGTITGSVPDNMTITNAGGSPVVNLSQIARDVTVDADAAGAWLRAVITVPAAGQVTFKINLNLSRFTYGDLIRVLARFRLSSSSTPGSGNPVSVIGLNTQIRVVTNSTAILAADSCSGTVGLPAALNEGMTGALVSPWMKLRPMVDASKDTFSSGYILVSLNFGGAGGCTLDLAHFHGRKLIA